MRAYGVWLRTFTAMSRDVVVGVDSGGSWLRITLADTSGAPMRRWVTRGGRLELGVPLVEVAARALRNAIGDNHVHAGAGSNAQGLVDAWSDADLGEVPFAPMSEAVMATAPGSGRTVVLIAGTGSAAATIVDGAEQLVTGATGAETDVGSGVWVGTAVASAAAAQQARRGPDTALTALVGATLFDETHSEAPLDYRKRASLAPLASQAASAGDVVALSICRRAADGLVGLLEGHHLDGVELVTVGGVASPHSVVGAMVRRRLRRELRHIYGVDRMAARWAASTLS